MEWNKDSFLALLMVYGSNVDMVMSDSEHDWIRSTFGETAHHQAVEFFNEHSEYGTLEKISELKDQFIEDEAAYDRCKNHLEGLFKADGKYSRIEKDVMHVLEKILRK